MLHSRWAYVENIQLNFRKSLQLHLLLEWCVWIAYILSVKAGKRSGLLLQMRGSVFRRNIQDISISPLKPHLEERGKRMEFDKNEISFQKELAQFPEGHCKYLLLFPSFMNFVSNFTKKYLTLTLVGVNLLNILNKKKVFLNFFEKHWELLFLGISELTVKLFMKVCLEIFVFFCMCYWSVIWKEEGSEMKIRTWK